MTTRYENRLRTKTRDADQALFDVQAHLAARDPETAGWLTDVRERLQSLAPDLDNEPAVGPRP